MHVLAAVHPLDRGNGGAGVYRRRPPGIGEFLSLHHACGSPGADCEQTGAESAQNRPDPVSDLSGADCPGMHLSPAGRNVVLRCAASLLCHRGNRRLFHEGRKHRRVSERLPRNGDCGVHAFVRLQFQPVLSDSDRPGLHRAPQRGAAHLSRNHCGDGSRHLREHHEALRRFCKRPAVRLLPGHDHPEHHRVFHL